MGTRHLIAVQLGGRYKVAQYGQWDGYPSGQGARVLNFLQQVNLEEFKERVGKLRWVRKEMIEAAYKKLGIHGDWMTMEESARFREAHPEWHRDTGAGILSLIMERDKLYLQNAIDFAGDGLFCEWCYVVDLDAGTLEVYSGFKKEPLTESDRFFKYDKDKSDYRAVSKIAEWSLDNLPSLDELIRVGEVEEDRRANVEDA